MRRVARPLVPAAVLIALAAAGTAGAAPAGKVIGKGVRLKTSKIFYAQGTAIAPKSVRATVATAPAQAVKVQWSLVCQKPNHADPAIQIGSSAKTGEAMVKGHGTVSLTLPFAAPPNCVASVYATLSGKGSLVLQVVQT